MFHWRLKLREAGEALSAGRVDEARKLLDDDDLRDFLPAKKLAGQVAEKFTERARQRFAWGESAAGMADLDAAEQLGLPVATGDLLRNEYAQAAAEQALSRLVAGEPDGALKRIERARRRGAMSESLRQVSEIATAWTEARRMAHGGQMTAAQEMLLQSRRQAEASAKSGLGTMQVAPMLDREADSLSERANEHKAAHERLHTAAAKQAWDEALSAADDCLRIAPGDPIAQGLRRRLWKEIGLGLTKTHPGRARQTPLAMPKNNRQIAQSLRSPSKEVPAVRPSTRRSNKSTEDTNAGAVAADRRMLWVDAVGGFLVCLDDEILLGQPASGSAGGATLPILADLSRRHAVLRREEGSYVLQPLGAVSVDGQAIDGPMVLADNNLITLGDSVRLRFTRPHALSSTARLVVESGHRTAPSADAVLLMADSCIMGSSNHCHVHCPRWKEDVILFRKTTSHGEDQLQCRSGHR